MFTALTVTVVGVGLSLLGMVQSQMYDIGIMVAFIGAIGVVLRFADWVRRSHE